MSGTVELYAGPLGWNLARNNVIVEGASDVAYMTRASDLHAAERGRHLLDGDLAILASGQGDDGGVDGVNRRLNFFWQLAEGERDAGGALRYRFIGLFDRDAAGKGAFAIASRFDRRIQPFVDIFLLHPVMPVFTPGYDRSMEIARANLPFARIDWEIEDLCSERIWATFEAQYPGAVLSKQVAGGRTHRELLPDKKPELKRIFLAEATFADAEGFIGLLRMLRIYLNLEHEFVRV